MEDILLLVGSDTLLEYISYIPAQYQLIIIGPMHSYIKSLVPRRISSYDGEEKNKSKSGPYALIINWPAIDLDSSVIEDLNPDYIILMYDSFNYSSDLVDWITLNQHKPYDLLNKKQVVKQDDWDIKRCPTICLFEFSNDSEGLIQNGNNSRCISM